MEWVVSTSIRHLGQPGDDGNDWIVAHPPYVLPNVALDVGLVGAGTNINAEFAYLQVVNVQSAADCGVVRNDARLAVDPTAN